MTTSSCFQEFSKRLTCYEKKDGILSKKAVFLMGSQDRGFPVWQISPLPGQKGIRLAKKRRGFLFCWMRASAIFSQAIPFPPRLFAEREEDDEEGKVKSQPFLSSPPALLPGQRQSGSKPPTKWEMSQSI
jgi:hypothetical protein